MEGGHDVIKIYQEAARVDPTMAKLRAAIWQSREREIDKFIQTMADSLKPGLNVKTATDICVALERPETRELILRLRVLLEAVFADRSAAAFLPPTFTGGGAGRDRPPFRALALGIFAAPAGLLR